MDTIEYKGYSIEIREDEDAGSPRDSEVIFREGKRVGVFEVSIFEQDGYFVGKSEFGL